MTDIALNPDYDRLELLKWVSTRNLHIPLSMLEFLVDTPPLIPDDDFGDEDYDEDDNWDCRGTIVRINDIPKT